jgi:hypothetical protein
MNSPESPVEHVYSELGRLLEHPELFGLGLTAPAALVTAVNEMREELSRAMSEPKQDERDGDLTEELSLDAA